MIRRRIVQNINDPNLFLNANVFGDFNDKTSDDSGYGELPGVEQTQTYFAYYDGAGRQDPELPKQTTFFIKYLIDTNGNVVKPQPNSTSVINMIDNFETGKPVIVTTKTPTIALNPLLGEKTVTHVGELSTLLVTNNGSGSMDYVTTMSFQNLLGISLAQTASDYNMTVRAALPGFYVDSDNNLVYPYPVLIGTDWVDLNNAFRSGTGTFDAFTLLDNNPSPAATWDPANGSYTFNTTTNPNGNSKVQFRIKLNLQVWSFDDPDTYHENIVRIRIQNNGITVFEGSPRTVVNGSQNGPSPSNQYFEWSTPFFNFTANDVVTFLIRQQNNGIRNRLVMYTQLQGGTSYIQVVNENQNFSGLIDGATAATANFFTIGEYPDQNGDPNAVYTSTSVITASQGLASMYREGTVQTLPSSVLSASYMQPWQPFYPLLPGDRIIFENNKNNVHTITEVIPSITASNGSSSFGLRVVPGISTGSIVDNFCIYRILDNGSQIMIDQEKPKGTAQLAFRGFIRPKYISQELETKFIDIINKLEMDGIIE
jgi:hypothetical protein